MPARSVRGGSLRPTTPRQLGWRAWKDCGWRAWHALRRWRPQVGAAEFSLPTAATTRRRFRRCPPRLCRCQVSAGADPGSAYITSPRAVRSRPVTRSQSPRKVGRQLFERRPSLRHEACAMFKLAFACSADRARRPFAPQGSTSKVPPRHRISFAVPARPNTPHPVRDRFNGLTSPRKAVCRIAHDLTPNEW
jgi:hypothetical protein